MINKQEFLINAYDSDEKIIIAKIIDCANQSLKKHEVVFTDFIDIVKSNKYVNMFSKVYDISCFAYGGNDDCERRIIAFYPDYMEIIKSEFPIKIVKITRNLKFSTKLSHRDYLGAILGLGIERKKIGDIILFDDYTICCVKDEVANYIESNLIKVGNCNVKTDIFKLNDFEFPEKKFEEKFSTVSSLRLDTVLSSAFNVSRSKAQNLINSQKVNINWFIVSNPSIIIKENDIISIRGFGRIKFKEVKGVTRKGKISIIYIKYI